MNRLEEFIAHLDDLVVFMAAGHEEVFSIIKAKESFWLEGRSEALSESFHVYQTSITHAAFLLGYAHFEAFLCDIARSVFLKRPQILPGNTSICCEEIRKLSSYEAVISRIIEKKLRLIFGKSIEDIIKAFNTKLQVPWPEGENGINSIIEASRTRNCLMHNGGIVGSELEEKSDYKLGDKIYLSTSKVHGYGLLIRNIAHHIWGEANSRHLQSDDS